MTQLARPIAAALALSFALVVPAAAQDAGGVSIEYSAAAAPRGTTAKKQAQEYLRSLGLSEGWNADKKLWIAVGSGGIERAPGDKGWDESRAIAFSKAVSAAKQDAAMRMGTAVKTAVESMSTSGTRLNASPAERAAAAATEAPPGIVDKVVAIIDAEVDKEYRKRVPPPAEAPADKAAREELEAKERRELTMAKLKESKFKSVTDFVTGGEVGAMQCFRTFEEVPEGSKGTVAVIMAYNENSRKVAEMLMGTSRSAPSGPAGTVRQDAKAWAEGLPVEVLLYSFGCQVRQDRNGELVLVAFGMGSPPADDEDFHEDAEQAARAAALEAARQFVGEMVAAGGGLTREQSLQVYEAADGNLEKIGETRSQLARTYASKADSLVLRGGDVLRQWEGRHPLSKVPTFGVVMKYSLSGAQLANAMRDQMDAIGGSKGGAGQTSRPPVERGAAGASGGTPDRRGRTGGAGAEPQVP